VGHFVEDELWVISLRSTAAINHTALVVVDRDHQHFAEKGHFRTFDGIVSIMHITRLVLVLLLLVAARVGCTVDGDESLLYEGEGGWGDDPRLRAIDEAEKFCESAINAFADCAEREMEGVILH
jgi:hypothetical protein